MNQKQAISQLEYLLEITEDGVKVNLDSDDLEAIRMGLNSLKVDEKYNLEYENGGINA